MRMIIALATIGFASAANSAFAQDVPGIENCMAEKQIERRTGCLQSNINFLQKMLATHSAYDTQKLDAANRQIDSLKGTVASLQKIVDELKATQKKPIEGQAGKAEPPKENPPAAKENPPPAKESAK